jgi:hypothetical protein
MKKILLIIPVLCFTVALSAQPPKGKAKKGTVYGEKVDKNGAEPADKLPSLIGTQENVDVKIQGKVTEVCQAMGCWVKVETVNGPIFVKMKDHAFYVPLALVGKNVVIEGKASIKETSVEMLKHYAEDAGKPQEEIDAITEPKKQLMLMANGIRVI